jgi:hypothetical protein
MRNKRKNQNKGKENKRIRQNKVQITKNRLINLKKIIRIDL